MNFNDATLIDIDMRLSQGKPLSPSQQAALRRHKAFEEKKNKRRGLKLREFRRRIGVSQTTLARMLRVSRRSICYYESGEHAPRRETQWLLLYFGYAWREMKWSLRRSDAIRRIGEMNTLSVESIVKFYYWWCHDERGYVLRDSDCRVLRIVLARWLDRPIKK